MKTLTAILLLLVLSLVFAAASKLPPIPFPQNASRNAVVVFWQTDTNRVAGWNLTVGTNAPQFIPLTAQYPLTNNTLTVIQTVSNVYTGELIIVDTVDTATGFGIDGPLGPNVTVPPQQVQIWIR